ncbi:class I SAM-dependent methyltransferase [Acidianus manzaensis]|uniref:Uncharacterized protein n=1 Tax=Acidianus manzaensis TaxID=282676 RepID=A0A1W6K0N0_9CREN|nr:class I SAM-dependent methyltransferase [Acidianus manzaensis]ARM76047.1 hypothetical protein B6F84_08440 [Acidianus manzaensis]
MKIAELKDMNDNETSLHEAQKLIIIDGKKEEISLAYGRISNFQKVDFLISKNLLYGEINFLQYISDFIINGEKIVRKEDSKYIPCKYDLCIGNSEISSGILKENNIIFFYPFPFRENSISSVLVFEILDYDLMRELYRVMKKHGKLKVMVRDNFSGGLTAKDILKYIIKFKIDKISWENEYWIIDARKL